MKKALLWIAGFLLALWAALWFGSRSTGRSYGSRDWPAGLGRLSAVPARYPQTGLSDGAVELMNRAAATGIDIAPRGLASAPHVDDVLPDDAQRGIGDWGGVQLARTNPTIDAPPPAVTAYLATQQSRLDAVRDHLLHGEAIVWPSNIAKGAGAPIPNLVGHMMLTRVLVARSLEKSRTRDAAAWDDLHAAWNLNRRLWSQPTMIEVMIALATTRMINAASMKAPGAEPTWFGELRAIDARKAMLAAQQAEAWMMTRSAGEAAAEEANGIKRALTGWYLDLGASNAAEHMRLFSADASALTQCAVDGEALTRRHIESIPRWNVLGRIAVPNLGGAWQRVMRYQAELEASARIRQLAQKQTVTTASRCSDGSWEVGGSTVRFSRALPLPAPGVAYPLEYTVTPD